MQFEDTAVISTVKTKSHDKKQTSNFSFSLHWSILNSFLALASLSLPPAVFAYEWQSTCWEIGQADLDHAGGLLLGTMQWTSSAAFHDGNVGFLKEMQWHFHIHILSWKLWAPSKQVLFCWVWKVIACNFIALLLEFWVSLSLTASDLTS